MAQKVLVTGAAGFLGEHLISSLVETDVIITALDITKPNPELVNRDADRISWVQADLTLDDLSNHLSGVDTVYHLAAKYLPGNSKEILNELFSLNVNGTRNVAEAAVSLGVKKFIHISSVAACESSDRVIITEDSGTPVTSYGHSKLKSEQVVIDCASNKMEYLILRPTALFGENHLGSIFEMVKAIMQKRYLIIGKGYNHVNFLYVKDLVDILLRAAGEPKAVDHTYIVAYEPITLIELTNCIKKELGLPPSKFHIPRALGMIIGFGFDIIAQLFHRPMPLSVDRVTTMTRDLCYCGDKLRERLSRDFKYGIYAGLAGTIKWYKAQGYHSLLSTCGVCGEGKFE